MLIAVPVLLILVLFALSNRQTVQLGFWPTDFALVAPLSLTVLIAMGIAFLLGGVLVWFSVVGARHRARRAERQVRLLEAEIAALKARILPAPASMPPPDA
jgi:lipopolysaccharide assembly protein A